MIRTEKKTSKTNNLNILQHSAKTQEQNQEQYHKLEEFQMNLTFERSFLPARSSNIKIVAILESTIEQKAFHDAVRKIALKHPLLRSKIQLNTDGNAFLTTKGGKFPKVTIIEGRSNSDIYSAIYQEDLKPANWESDPTSRFLLIKGIDNHDIIIAYVHHTIADGRSVAFVMQHLLEILANPDQEISILKPVSMLEVLPADVKISKLLRKLLGLINKKWKKEKVTFTMKDFLQVAQKKYGNGPDLYVDQSLTAAETSLLRKAARNHGVSVNSLILASIIIAKQSEETAPTSNKVGFAVDIRKKLIVNPGEACNLLASGLMVNPKYKPEINIWDLALNVHTKTLESLDSNKKLFLRRVMAPLMDPTFNDAMYMMQLSSWEGTPMLRKMGKKKSPVGAVLTNLGGMHFPLEYQGKNPIKLVDAIFFPPIGAESMIEFGASSLAGKLHIVTVSRHNAANKQLKETVIRKLLEILQKIYESNIVMKSDKGS